MVLTVITNDPIIAEFLDSMFGVDLDYTDEIYDEYYCINVKPFKCMSCGTLICYAVAGPHLILIFPEKDGDEILAVADLMKKDKDDEFDPRIVRYNRILGPCVSFEDAVEQGWIGGELIH